MDEAGLAEALIVYYVGNTGPWLVNMESKGIVLYDRLYGQVNEKLKEIYKRINLPKDFEYTSKAL